MGFNQTIVIIQGHENQILIVLAGNDQGFMVLVDPVHTLFEILSDVSIIHGLHEYRILYLYGAVKGPPASQHRWPGNQRAFTGRASM